MSLPDKYIVVAPEKQLSFCFEPVACGEPQRWAESAPINYLTVIPVSHSKVIAFPQTKQLRVESKLLARILQRATFF